MKTVIGIVGVPASGKGTLAQHLVEDYGAAAFRFGQPLKDILARVSLPATRDNLVKLSETLRATFGEDLLATAVAADAEASDAPVVVVDGVRREADLEIFGTMPGFHLVAVTAPPEIRYERAKKRAEKPEEATQTYDEFLALERRSTEVSAAALVAKAEVVFDNAGSIEDLFRQADAWLASIGVTKA